MRIISRFLQFAAWDANGKRISVHGHPHVACHLSLPSVCSVGREWQAYLSAWPPTRCVPSRSHFSLQRGTRMANALLCMVSHTCCPPSHLPFRLQRVTQTVSACRSLLTVKREVLQATSRTDALHPKSAPSQTSLDSRLRPWREDHLPLSEVRDTSVLLDRSLVTHTPTAQLIFTTTSHHTAHHSPPLTSVSPLPPPPPPPPPPPLSAHTTRHHYHHHDTRRHL
jgi:hypothetical protein